MANFRGPRDDPLFPETSRVMIPNAAKPARSREATSGCNGRSYFLFLLFVCAGACRILCDRTLVDRAGLVLPVEGGGASFVMANC